jgi:hypothetical protein
LNFSKQRTVVQRTETQVTDSFDIDLSGIPEGFWRQRLEARLQEVDFWIEDVARYLRIVVGDCVVVKVHENPDCLASLGVAPDGRATYTCGARPPHEFANQLLRKIADRVAEHLGITWEKLRVNTRIKILSEENEDLEGHELITNLPDVDPYAGVDPRLKALYVELANPPAKTEDTSHVDPRLVRFNERMGRRPA